MSIWDMLKIQETKDIEIIKNAYYTLLENHSDDETMLEILSMAYNSALYYATTNLDSELLNSTTDSNENEAISNGYDTEFDALYSNNHGIDFSDIDEKDADDVANNEYIESDESLDNFNDNNYDFIHELFFSEEEDTSSTSESNIIDKPKSTDKFTLLKEELSQAIQDNNIVLADRTSYSAMMINPNDSELLALMGRLNFIKGDFKKSKDFFDKAFTIDRSNPESLFMYGKTLSSRRNFIDACKIFREALDLAPSNLPIKYCLAVSNYLCKNYIEAKLLFDSIPLDAPYDFDINLYQESIESLITGKSFLTLTDIPTIMKL